MAPDVYFAEEQRWPSRSQRSGWIVAVSIVAFSAYQLNLHRFAPLLAGVLLLVLLAVALTVLTIQQRLSVRIASESGIARRVLRRANPDAPLTIQLVYMSKGPVSTISPNRRGSRLGRRDRRIELNEVENWSIDRLPLFPRRGGSAYRVGGQRDVVTFVLISGERLTIPTRIPATLVKALAEARVDSVKQQQQAAPVVREEL